MKAGWRVRSVVSSRGIVSFFGRGRFNVEFTLFSEAGMCV